LTVARRNISDLASLRPSPMQSMTSYKPTRSLSEA
jgi:hypothetical protein